MDALNRRDTPYLIVPERRPFLLIESDSKLEACAVVAASLADTTLQAIPPWHSTFNGSPSMSTRSLLNFAIPFL
jgi:hypothetical protein